MKENLLLLKDLLELSKLKSTNTWLQYQKNMYIVKLDDVVDECNNIYNWTIKMEPVDLEDNTYFDFDKKFNDRDPKFKVGDHARISK